MIGDRLRQGSAEGNAARQCGETDGRIGTCGTGSPGAAIFDEFAARPSVRRGNVRLSRERNPRRTEGDDARGVAGARSAARRRRAPSRRRANADDRHQSRVALDGGDARRSAIAIPPEPKPEWQMPIIGNSRGRRSRDRGSSRAGRRDACPGIATTSSSSPRGSRSYSTVERGVARPWIAVTSTGGFGERGVREHGDRLIGLRKGRMRRAIEVADRRRCPGAGGRACRAARVGQDAHAFLVAAPIASLTIEASSAAALCASGA